MYWAPSNATKKEDERLAVRHVAHPSAPLYTYEEVKQMLKANDFSRIPGFDSRYATQIRKALEQFVLDVDAQYMVRNGDC
jgi:hypothetical protein